VGIFRRSDSPRSVPAPLVHVAVGAKVHIIGEPGNYVVVRVDPQRYTADLMLVGQRSKMEFGVHFRSLRLIPEPGAAPSGVSDLTTMLE
jgi:hypothetical protein